MTAYRPGLGGYCHLTAIGPNVYVVDSINTATPGCVKIPSNLNIVVGSLYHHKLFHQEKFSFEMCVLLVHFNQIKYLQQCLKQYARQTLPKNKFQVVIADDGTPGGIDNVVQAFPMMNIKVVTNPRNDPNIRRNPAQVLNVGMANVDAPIGVWHSADIIPCNTNNLQIMFDFHKRNAGRRVRGRLVKLDKNTTNNIFSGRLKSVDCASPRLYHAPSSFNLCDVMTIGGFSQCFKSWGWEDSDFARRMHGIGADIKHDERLSYVHLYHPSHNMGIKGESRSIFNAIAGHMTSVHKL